MLPIANTNTTNTFDYWRERTNDMARAFSNCVVTTDANASSTATDGNAAITGAFTAANGFYASNTGKIFIGNTFVNTEITPDTFFVGNSSTYYTIQSNTVSLVNNNILISTSSSANLIANSSGIKISNSTSNTLFTIPTAAQYSSGDFYLNANGSWNQISVGSIIKNEEKLVNAADKTVDTFSKSVSATAEYLVYVKDNNANSKMSSKLLVFHDETTAYITEYAQLVSNTNLGVFSANVSGANVFLSFNLTVTSCNVVFTRIIV